MIQFTVQRKLIKFLAFFVLIGFGFNHAIADDEIKVGSIFDLTGGLNIYGIQQSRALHLAVDSINANGGILGQQIQVIENDAQSELAKFTQYANAMILRDQIDVLFAGLTSSSREAMRPIIREHKIPYFYSALYEGGACDKYTFITGASASQQMSVLIEWAIKNYGPKMYVMAPDYNFGTISAHWVELCKPVGRRGCGRRLPSSDRDGLLPDNTKNSSGESRFCCVLASRRKSNWFS